MGHRLPIPGICIWCRRQEPDIKFDESHIVPAWAGNDQQVLPPGIVCKPCNNMFSRDVEKALLDNALFDLLRWYKGLVNSRTGRVSASINFDAPYITPPGPQLPLEYEFTAGNQGLILTIKSPIQKTLPPQIYTERSLRFLSRAFHKMAFEGLAYEVYCDDKHDFIDDPFNTRFDAVRQWGKEGRPPHGLVRPVLLAPYSQDTDGWDMVIFHHNGELIGSFGLYGQQFFVSLTASSAQAWQVLGTWARDKILQEPGIPALWGISKSLFTFVLDRDES